MMMMMLIYIRLSLLFGIVNDEYNKKKEIQQAIRNFSLNQI